MSPDIATDSGTNPLPYVRWRPEWEWDFVKGMVYVGKYQFLAVPANFQTTVDPENADILVGAILLNYGMQKRVEIYNAQVYYVPQGKISMAAQLERAP